MWSSRARLSLTVLLGMALLLALAASSDSMSRIFLPFVSRSGSQATGTLAGEVHIGPLCPVEPCPQPTPDVYSSRQLVLTPQAGAVIRLALTKEGTFRAAVPATIYQVDLTDCTYMGCRQALPRPVTVAPNAVTELIIDIDTGIR